MSEGEKTGRQRGSSIMTREIQHSSGRRRQSSLPAVVPSTPPFDPELLRLRVNYFGLTAVPSTLLLTAMTGGQFGESALVAVLLGGAAGYFGPKLQIGRASCRER